MADTIGALGSANVNTVGTTTVYTCGSGKGARVRIMYRGVAGANSTIRFNVNGIPVAQSAAITDTHNVYSTKNGLINSGANLPAGNNDDNIIAGTAVDFFLSSGNLVSYTIGTADFSQIEVRVVGVEVEV